jgi:hypothetical protein
MKTMLFALAVVVVVIGISAYVVHTDPNRAQTRAAFDVLHEEPSGVPDEFNDAFSVDQAMKETQSRLVLGTLLQQDYLLRRAEYKLAQIRSVGGNTNAKELEEKRSAYAAATKRFQAFRDTNLPVN